MINNHLRNEIWGEMAEIIGRGVGNSVLAGAHVAMAMACRLRLLPRFCGERRRRMIRA